MAMRENCRHFAARSYDDGEVARFCVLDLAPEAPWRCPENCASFAPTVIDGTFVTGSLNRPDVEPEPDEDPEAIADLLDDAEQIVDGAEAGVLEALEAEEHDKHGHWWHRRKHDEGGDDWHLSSR